MRTKSWDFCLISKRKAKVKRWRIKILSSWLESGKPQSIWWSSRTKKIKNRISFLKKYPGLQKQFSFEIIIIENYVAKFKPQFKCNKKLNIFLKIECFWNTEKENRNGPLKIAHIYDKAYLHKWETILWKIKFRIIILKAFKFKTKWPKLLL
jgi:hypothetical protein